MLCTLELVALIPGFEALTFGIAILTYWLGIGSRGGIGSLADYCGDFNRFYVALVRGVA